MQGDRDLEAARGYHDSIEHGQRALPSDGDAEDDDEEQQQGEDVPLRSRVL